VFYQNRKEVDMRLGRREEARPRVEEKVLDVNAGMQGTLRFDDPVNLKINGKFEGMLETKGTLVIGDQAHIDANISGDVISVAGVVNGNLKAATMLRLISTARIHGDVETPRIFVEEGAILNGSLRMTKEPRPASMPSGDWMSMTQLAKYLEVDTRKVTEWVSSGVLPGTKEGGDWIFQKDNIDRWIAEGKVRA
jgi:excisionase family DNA binding protein